MTNNERIQARIQRDKLRKQQKRLERAKEFGTVEKVFTLQHLFISLQKRIRGTSWKGSVQAYISHAIVKNNRLKKRSLEGKLPENMVVRSMTLCERGKIRNIQMVDIESRVQQGCCCDNALIPILQPTLIYDNPASTKGKGVSFARRRLEHQLQKLIRKNGSDFYVFTFDFKSFFDSIRHKLCFESMERHFISEPLISLIMKIIRIYKESRLPLLKNKKVRLAEQTKLENMQGVGITLGSQISQVMALVAPNRIDHMIKDSKGIECFERYMDDGIMLHENKEILLDVWESIKTVAATLGLKFNEAKTHIVKATQGFTFLKIRYRITENGRIIKRITRSSIVRMRRKLKKFVNKVKESAMLLDDVYNAVSAWLGCTKTARTYKARKRMLNLYNRLFHTYRMKGVKI